MERYVKTEVVMKRSLFDQQISQKSKSGFLSATDLVRAGNIWRKENNLGRFNLNDFLRSKGTKSFITTLEEEYEGPVKINSKGHNSHTWVHPYLFIDIALAISPTLKIKVYSWLYDYLLKYRNDSGDSYKKMCGALYANCSNKTDFPNDVKEIARKIKELCKVQDWETATENQLSLRDKIQENIALLADVLKHNKDAIKYGIERTYTELEKLEVKK
jgi:hypothetical protein